MKKLLLVLVLLFPSFAYSQDVPNQTIVGAGREIKAGEVVQLYLSSPPVFPNLVSTKTDWLVFEPEFDAKTKAFRGYKRKEIAYSKDDKVFFGAGLETKTLLVVVSVNYVFEEKTDGKVTKYISKTVLLSDTVYVIGKDCEEKKPEPEPEDEPEPEPEPEPADEVENKFGLSKFASDEAARVGVNARGSSKALAQSFKNIATQIGAGALKGYENIFAALAASNGKALGQNKQAWVEWSKKIGDRLFDLADAGNWQDSDYKQAFLECAAGLDKVK